MLLNNTALGDEHLQVPELCALSAAARSSTAMICSFFGSAAILCAARRPAQAPAQVTAIRAGRLLDPEGARILTNR